MFSVMERNYRHINTATLRPMYSTQFQSPDLVSSLFTSSLHLVSNQKEIHGLLNKTARGTEINIVILSYTVYYLHCANLRVCSSPSSPRDSKSKQSYRGFDLLPSVAVKVSITTPHTTPTPNTHTHPCKGTKSPYPWFTDRTNKREAEVSVLVCLCCTSKNHEEKRTKEDLTMTVAREKLKQKILKRKWTTTQYVCSSRNKNINEI